MFGHWRLGCLYALVCVMTSCSVERPDNVLSDTEMENVLYDFHMAKALGEQTDRGENYKRVLYLDYVYKKHGITEAHFDSSMVWFSRHPDVLSNIYKKVAERLRAEEIHIEKLVALREHKPLTSRSGDSIDVWAWQRIYKLTGMPMDNRVDFILPSDSNFQIRDTLVWRVRFTFLHGAYDSLHAPVMAMQMRFGNDSIVGDYLRVCEEGIRNLTLTSDTLGDIKEVNGFIYYPPCPENDDTPIVVTDVVLMRYHFRAADSLAQDKKIPAISDTLQKDKSQNVVPETKREVKEEESGKERKSRLTPAEIRNMQKLQEQPARKGDYKALPQHSEIDSRRQVSRLKQQTPLCKPDRS